KSGIATIRGGINAVFNFHGITDNNLFAFTDVLARCADGAECAIATLGIGSPGGKGIGHGSYCGAYVCWVGARFFALFARCVWLRGLHRDVVLRLLRVSSWFGDHDIY